MPSDDGVTFTVTEAGLGPLVEATPAAAVALAAMFPQLEIKPNSEQPSSSEAWLADEQLFIAKPGDDGLVSQVNVVSGRVAGPSAGRSVGQSLAVAGLDLCTPSRSAVTAGCGCWSERSRVEIVVTPGACGEPVEAAGRIITEIIWHRWNAWPYTDAAHDDSYDFDEAAGDEGW